jgi:hypothetical protein
MGRRLSILAFLLLFGSGFISGGSPHLEGEGGCTMQCCKAAHDSDHGSLLPKLCCKLECKQPASTQTSNPSSQFFTAARSLPAVSFSDAWRHAFCLNQARFSHSLTRNVQESSCKFLKTGALLI